MPKLKLTGRKLCTSGRKLAVCGCGPSGDPCCDLSGFNGFVTPVGGLRQSVVTGTFSGTQTTQGWWYEDPAISGVQIVTSAPASLSFSITSNTPGSSAQPTCAQEYLANHGAQWGSPVPDSWNVFSGSSFTVDSNAAFAAGLACFVNVQGSLRDTSLYVSDPAGTPSVLQQVLSVGAYAGADVCWQLDFAIALYDRRKEPFNELSTKAIAWRIIVRVTKSGAYRVWVERPSFQQPGLGWTLAVPSFVVTPTVSGEMVTAVGVAASLVANRPAYQPFAPNPATAPAQTDTLDFTAQFDSNVNGCPLAPPSLAALDDALFS